MSDNAELWPLTGDAQGNRGGHGHQGALQVRRGGPEKLSAWSKPATVSCYVAASDWWIPMNTAKRFFLINQTLHFGYIQKARLFLHDWNQAEEEKNPPDHVIHSCQPLLGVNLSSVCEAVFPLRRPGCFDFSLVAAAFWNSSWHVWRRKEEAMCAKYTCTASNLISKEIS